MTETRWTEILALLDKHDRVKTQDLIEQLQVSESTIRRDLTDLEALGKLVRVHGGAQAIPKVAIEPIFDEKLQQQQNEKEAIAKYAATLIKDGEAIYLDAGTSTLAMIPYLTDKPHVKITTNSMKHAEICSKYGLEVMIIGGFLKEGTQAIIGSNAVRQLRHCYFDRVFMGMNAVSIQNGWTTPDPEEGAIKATAIEQGRKVYGLIDYTKIDRQTFFKVAEISDVQIITNTLPKEQSEKYQKYTKVKEVTTL